MSETDKENVNATKIVFQGNEIEVTSQEEVDAWLQQIFMMGQ